VPLELLSVSALVAAAASGGAELVVGDAVGESVGLGGGITEAAAERMCSCWAELWPFVGR